MKKLLLLCASVAILACTASCGLTRQDNLSKSYLLNEGMTKQEVAAIMGEPCRNEFIKGVDEWHYCKTGFSADEFLACYFYKGKLVATKAYTVTQEDVGAGVSGSCQNFIKRGTYYEPDVVVSIRSRVTVQ